MTPGGSGVWSCKGVKDGEGKEDVDSVIMGQVEVEVEVFKLGVVELDAIDEDDN